MKPVLRVFVLISFCIALGAGIGVYVASQKNTASKTTPPKTTQENTETNINLSFGPDEGNRAELASNAGVKMNGSDLLLLYESHDEPGGQHVDVATEKSDWLSFSSSTENTNPDNFRAHRLPDGTWRAYGINSTIGIDGSCLKSQSSTDGITFTEDEGCRYELDEGDNGRMGVYELFNTSEGNVVLLYLGDLMGKNNTRRAISTDGGWTFTFEEGNVLGDDDAGGGARSYVDEKVIAIDEKTFYLVAMKAGIIYGFLSTDDGKTFELQGEILNATDFGVTDGSLHDPQIIKLPDGRYRIFVTLANRTTKKEAIVSATSQ